MDAQEAKAKCKLTQGEDTCAFLAFEPGGWTCTRGTAMELIIRERLSAGTMKAKWTGCDDAPSLIS